MNRSLRQILVSVIVAGCALQPVSVVAAPKTKTNVIVPTSLYAQIKELYLPDIGMLAVEEKPEKPVAPVQDKKEDKPPDLVIKPLTEAEKKTIAFDLLARNDKSVKSSYLPRHGWLDMELFENANLANVINRTRTSFGEAVLAKMLIADREIDPRVSQAAVKELVHNDELRNNLDELLKVFAHAEDVFLKSYQEEDETVEKHFEQLYFGLKSDANPKKLDVYNGISNLRAAGQIAGVDILMLAIGYLELKLFFCFLPEDNLNARRDFEKFMLPGVGFALTPPAMLWAGAQILSGNLSFLRRFGAPDATINRLHQDLDIRSGAVKTVIAVYGAMYVLLWAGMAALGYKSLKTYDEITKHLQTKMIFASAATRSILECHVRCTQTSSLPAAIPELDAVKKFFVSAPEKLQRLISLLNTDTFKGGTSFWSHHGHTLIAHQLMRELKYEFRNVLETLGTIDAYVSMAKLYKEFEGTNTPYCFVEFSNQKTPHIKATDFWNPQVATEKAVLNSIELGRIGGCRNMILTGQNTAGKSTTLRSVLHCALLGQVFGVVPAKAMVMTPFKSVFTHIIVKDDIANGLSLYKAEVNQVRDMQQVVRPLKRDEFCLVVIDEIFRSTGEQQAVVLARDCANWLAQYPNVMVIQSTHKPELIKLEQETKGLYKNFKMEIVKQDNGLLYRPHKIEEGSTTANVAAEILAEEGVDFSR